MPYDKGWLFVVIAENITQDVSDFNAVVKDPNGNRVEMKKRLCDIVQVYSDAKE